MRALIIYGSQYGTTKRYAEKFSQMTGIPCTNYEELKDDPGYQRWLDSNGTIPFPEGEGQEAFLERTRHGFEQMMEHLMDLQCREAAFVVHGGTIMAVLSAFSQTGGDFYDWQVSNGSGYSAIAEEESWRQGKKQLTEIEKL